MTFPQAPAKINDEKLYAQLYRGYLKACRSIGAQNATSAPLSVSSGTSRKTRVQRIPVTPKEPSTVRVRSGEETNCEICGHLLPSRNALFRHLKAVCWQKKKTELVYVNPDNDSTDSDDPFTVLSIDSLSNKSNLLAQCSQAEGGLLPLGFLDMLGASEVPGLDFIAPPEPILGNNPGDGKPKKERLNFQIEIRKQEMDTFADEHGYNIDPEYEKDLASQTRTLNTILDKVTPGNMSQVHSFLSEATTNKVAPPIEDLAVILAGPQSHLSPPPMLNTHHLAKVSKADAVYRSDVSKATRKAADRARELYLNTLQENSNYKYYTGNLRRASLSNEPISIVKAKPTLTEVNPDDEVTFLFNFDRDL